jgi:arginine decarboxylase
VPRRAEAREGTLVPIPTRFFVTSGKGINKTSELNAFDLALLQAGIGEQNLVSVSSVLPIGVRQVDRLPIARGAITHCVLEEIAHFRGVELRRIHYRTEELVIPMDHYGVCIAACVFLP